MSAGKRIRADPSLGKVAPPEPTRILLVNQYYWPSNASTAQHLTDLAESLAVRGHECHVLCGKGGYGGGASAAPSREVRNGVTIHRVGGTSLGRRSTLRRMTDYLSFYAGAILASLRLPRCDLAITLTTPPIIGLIGGILARFKGTKHVSWSMDLHPDAGLAIGFFSRRNPLVAALGRISDAVYRAADKVIVLGPYMADRVAAKGVRPDRIETIPVWSRRDEVYPVPVEANPLLARLGLEGRFVAMYSGNLGLAHAFDDFVDAARALRHREDIAFLFVGDGPRRAEVASAVESEGLANVVLADYFPRERLHESLSLADVHLISMRREMTGIVVPSKLYGAMASGRPTVFVGPEHCEAADAIREAGCGVTLRPGDPAGLVAALETLAADRDAARAMGARGRAAFLEHYEREGCCAAWCGMIAEVLGRAAPAPAPVRRPAPPRRDLVVPIPSRVGRAS